MPELPDITVYIEAIEKRISGHELLNVRLGNPFLLRTADPPLSAVKGKEVTSVKRIGKRIAICLENELWLVIHLMIAGRLHWRGINAKLAGKNSIGAFDFENGTLLLTEAGTERRASLHIVPGNDALSALDPGGLEPLEMSLTEFTAALTLENHTLKRSLTDPHLFSGIGNTFSDEILWQAKLSPALLTQKMTPGDIERLYMAIQVTLKLWIERLRSEVGDGFPEKVTAFRPEMAVHGKYEQPCPRCGDLVQRIRYASNETNYCVTCQTGGKLLADRALSRLLRKDWPTTLQALEGLAKK